MQKVEEWSDNFGNQVSHGIKTSVDIPSSNPFNAERLRYFKNGSRIRQRDLAGESTFTDREADYFLEPASGDTLRLRSAERPRYVVGVDVGPTLTGHHEQPLQEGDTWRFGLSDDQTPENAAFFEVNGGSANQLVLKRGGTIVKEVEWEYPEGVDETTPIRYLIKYNWHGVGPFEFSVYFTDQDATDEDRSVTKNVGTISVRDGKTTNDPNFHIFHEIDASSSNLQYSAGSMGFVVYSDALPSDRQKSARLTGLNYGGSGEYEPLAAIRIDPPRGNIFAELAGIEAVPDAGSGQLLATVMPQSETDASDADFDPPPEHSDANSVIQQTTNITQFTDVDGNLVTSTNDPDGYQVGFFSTDTSTQGASRTRQASRGRATRPLFEDDVAVFLYKGDTTNSRTVNIVYDTNQLW